jgi:hypothetical protein
VFERYTEKARRVIFFGRYEASQFGSPCIETEHLLLGLVREDKELANRYLKSTAAIESIRKQIEQHVHLRGKVGLSVDLPLSHECKRILAFGAEEAERLGHKHIGTDHILLGILREENCFAAQILQERGLRLSPLRNEVAPHRPDFAIYAGKVADIDGDLLGQDNSSTPTTQIALVKQKIKFVIGRMENAIANHDFERAHVYSDEEGKERENLRVLRERYGLQENTGEPQQVPFLCIQIARDEPLAETLRAVDDWLTTGTTEVWSLVPDLKRAYIANAAGGLRELKGDVLRFEEPLVELPLHEIFS